MFIEVFASTDLTYGGSPFDGIGGFLVDGAPSFGPAIEGVQIVLAMPPIPDPNAWLAEQAAVNGESYQDPTLSGAVPWAVARDEYERARAALPKVVFRRSQARAEVHVRSEIVYPRQWITDQNLVSDFVEGVDEVIAALGLLESRLDRSDDFDLNALLAHCELARVRLPGTPKDLDRVLEEALHRDVVRVRSQTGWAAVDVDFDEFHQAARELLDDPFFWDETDDDAPHGNDTGADLLALYRDAIEEDPRVDTASWTRRLLVSWGANDDSDEAMLMRDEAWIAAAFAELKVRGRLAPELAREALASVDRLRRRPPDAGDDGDHEGKLAKIAERLNALM
ncbi:hypothetical protein [Blastococcus sp. Marseille-P5729]|uniref:hypothetical protein n=1 Tax=Blastococcus sp. Marseille-P5729 TaxID=2086582 RepID=UPI00131B2477|nr:hypothetical protein [Blastococcus sp. Marseille-P5729]